MLDLVDKTILGLSTVVISGLALLAPRFLKYDHPKAHLTFTGSNPFASKRTIINSQLTMAFTSLALAGLGLQGIVIVWAEEIPDRLHGAVLYLLFSSFAVVLMVGFSTMVSRVTRWSARREWLPVVIEGQRELFARTDFVLSHDGWREDQFALRDQIEDSRKYQQANLQTAEDDIAQIEELLEIRSAGGQRDRLDRIRLIFEEHGQGDPRS